MLKPTIIFPLNGNMHELYIAAMTVLRKNGRAAQVRELHLRSIGAPNLRYMLRLVQEFVEVRQGRPDA